MCTLSSGLCLERLRAWWTRLALKVFRPLRLGGRLLVIGDGRKVAKEGRKMPAVKKLHQSSANNSKATYLFGHSFQALGLLVCGPLGHLLSVPLTSRIHEGVVFSNRDRRTLLDKFVQLFLAVVGELEAGVLLVVDAYYASGKILRPLLTADHHVLTRLAWNAVGYYPAPAPKQRRRGRPRRYGPKVRLWDLWSRHRMSTDLSLIPLALIAGYGYRFKIELAFRQAIYTLGTYAYHFWMMAMTPLARRSGNQYLHRASADYRRQIRRKLDAYHRYVQLGCIAQGLLQYLALHFRVEVWRCSRHWLRTMNPALYNVTA